jgi:di/tricarboxylate transporter
MALLWVTEAVPISATALLPLVLLPLLGISPIKQAAAPYADPIIYLFMAGSCCAGDGALESPPTIALAIINSVGTRSRSLVLGFLCAATAFLPVNGALAMGVNQPALLLCVPVAVAASADFALPVGTPPNAIAYSSGLVSLPRRVKAEIWVDLLFAVLLPC